MSAEYDISGYYLNTILSFHRSLITLYGGKPGFNDGDHLKTMANEINQRFNNLREQGQLPKDHFFDRAAAYFYGILKAKSFVDGNKRTALALALYELEGINDGMGTQYDEEELFTLVTDAAKGTKSEKGIADYFRANNDPVYFNGSYFYKVAGK